MLVASMDTTESGHLIQLLELYASNCEPGHGENLKEIVLAAKNIVNSKPNLEELSTFPRQALTLAFEAVCSPTLTQALKDIQDPFEPEDASILLKALNENAR